MSKDGNNDVVLIELDRPRELRYGHKALKKLVAITGTKVDDIDIENIDLAEIEKYIFCGLLSDAKENGETLALEDMEDLLDRAPTFAHIVEQMTKAFNVSFGGFAIPEDDEGNLVAPAKVPATGTGKNL